MVPRKARSVECSWQDSITTSPLKNRRELVQPEHCLAWSLKAPQLRCARVPRRFGGGMKSRTVLLQWIGHSDLRAMAATLPSVKQRQLLDRVGGDASQAGDHGPTKTLLTTQDFDEVRLLSNYPKEWNQWYLKWLDVKSAVVIPVELPKPTDYVAIYRIADAELSKLRQRATWCDTQLCLHLSPGTPAMAAVW